MLLRNLKRLFGRETAPASFAIPVLCYHSWTMTGDAYEGNDHVALEHDLRTLAARGYGVLPLTLLVDILRGAHPAKVLAGRRWVGLSMDDGRDHDYLDLTDADGRRVRAMHSILAEYRDRLPILGSGPMAVSFVIASPQARRDLDRSCGDGLDQWRDAWWAECAATGILGIANHSWDHVHDTLARVRQRDNRKGSFLAIDTFDDAEGQIAEAQRYIAERCEGHELPLFGYPYGHVPPYLRDEYFPKHGARLGITGAFGTGGASVRPDTPVWDIPRFVCGWHWRTEQEFGALLDAVERGER